MNKKINLWYLYDFANSFASSVVIFYLPLLLSVKGYSDYWIGVGSAISTSVLLFLYPYLGYLSDLYNTRKMKYIRVSSFFMFVTMLLIAFVSLQDSSSQNLFYLILLYVIFQISFQGSYVFYASQMNSIVDDNETHKNKVSSIGMGLGQLGNAVSLGLAAFLLAKSLTFFEFSSTQILFILNAFIFIILSIPYLCYKFYLDANKKVVHNNSASIHLKIDVLSHSIRMIIKLFKNHKSIFYFLVGYMLIADSVFTLQVYISLYIKKVFLLSEKDISIILGVSLLSLFCTCVFLGVTHKKISNLSKIMFTSSIIYIVSFINLSLAKPSFVYILFSFVFTGIAYGLFFPIARSYYSSIIPNNSQAEYFSFFVIFERAATIIGPLVFSLILYLYSGEVIGYRLAIGTLSAVSLLGVYFINKSYKF